MDSDTTASAPPAADPATGGAAVPWITLVAARPAASAARDVSTRGVLLRLAAGLAAVMIVIALVAVFAAQWLAEREAVNDAANVTDVLADAVIRPALTDALADGDPAAVRAFDRVIREQVLGDDIVRVKIWNPDGRVLYADERQLIGRTFELDRAQREALAAPSTRAAVSDLSEDENQFEAGSRLLEVYRPVWTPDGRQLLFEVYLPYEPVAARSAELWRGFAGVTTSSLLVLVVLTAPIVWGLIAGLRGAEARRTALLERAVDASDAERRRIAGTLHDGPVQELVATSLAAESAADAAQRRGETDAAGTLRDVAGAVRGNVKALRSLLVDIYPESLSAAGLEHALTDLAATARTRGVQVRISAHTPLDGIGPSQERVLYRIAQEALRNAARHAAPCTVDVQISRSADLVILEVADDGPGFDPRIMGRPREDGHLGTLVLVDLATEAGAELSLATAPGAGTRWRVVLPPREDAEGLT